MPQNLFVTTLPSLHLQSVFLAVNTRVLNWYKIWKCLAWFHPPWFVTEALECFHCPSCSHEGHLLTFTMAINISSLTACCHETAEGFYYRPPSQFKLFIKAAISVMGNKTDALKNQRQHDSQPSKFPFLFSLVYECPIRRCIWMTQKIRDCVHFILKINSMLILFLNSNI